MKNTDGKNYIIVYFLLLLMKYQQYHGLSMTLKQVKEMGYMLV